MNRTFAPDSQRKPQFEPSIRVRRAFAAEISATGPVAPGRTVYVICKEIRRGLWAYNCFDVPHGWRAPVTRPGAARLWERLGGDDTFKTLEVA